MCYLLLYGTEFGYMHSKVDRLLQPILVFICASIGICVLVGLHVILNNVVPPGEISARALRLTAFLAIC